MSRAVWLAAGAAVLARFPGLLWPLRPDEAGFLLVARSWDPQPDSPYGHYWVDRPPHVLWVVQWADRIGGPYFHRLVGALACALLVLAAAAAAREVVRASASASPRAERHAAILAAVLAAALVSNAEIDPVAAKGEIFGLPLVMGGCWLALRAVRLRSWTSAVAGGVLAALAVGMKQSMVSALVFGGVLLVGSAVARRSDLRGSALLAAAASVGALVPVAATVWWADASGVRLQSLWYAVVGFRSDATAVLAAQPSSAPDDRADVLLLIFLTTGMALVLTWLLLRGHEALRRVPVPAVAVAIMLVVDIAALVLSGSFWKPYLFTLVPGLVLGAACLVAADSSEPRRRPRLAQLVVGVTVISAGLSMIGWVELWNRGVVHHEVRTGAAIAERARPGETLLVYGGRADIQWASGLPSPYPYLWSLPMRTLDPGLRDLHGQLTGPRPPTWFVEAAHLGSWELSGGDEVERSLLRNYDYVATACDRYRVHRLKTDEPMWLNVDCSTPARGLFGDW